MSAKPAAPSLTTTPSGSILLSKERIIPGFNAQPQVTKSQRKRSKKSAALPPQAEVAEQATLVPEAEEVNGVPEFAAVSVARSEDELVPEEKKTSATEATAKRLRAANKKMQRIEGYEAKTDALNADQKNAIASKPVVTAVIKELSELLDILKAEEADDVAREKRTASIEAKKAEREVATAVSSAQAESQKDVVLLLQFLHLHGLFNQGNSPSAFAPAPLPPAIANATANEAAAVGALYDAFANGPLLGGGGDAVEKLAALNNDANDEIVLGVTFARVKELIVGMTSVPEAAEQIEQPPARELAPEIQTEVITPQEAATPAGPSDSVTALVDGSTDGATSHPPSFLQKSELEPPATVTPPVEEKVTSWAEDVETTAVATPTVTESSINAAAPSPAPAPARAVWGAPAAAAAAAAVVGKEEAAPVSTSTWNSAPTTTDWSAEDADGGLPSLEGLTTVAPSAAVVAAPAPINGEAPAAGQAPASRGRGGRGEGRGGRGSFRGGEGSRGGNRGGRGGGRGGARGGHQNQQQQQPAAEDGWTAVPSSRPQQQPMRGSFRVSSEGRGGRGGRGGPRGPSRAPSAVQEGGAAPAPTGERKW